MVDGKSVRDGQFGDPASKKESAELGQMLLKDAQTDKGVLDEIARQQGYKQAVKSEPEAEVSWNRAFPKGERSLSHDKIKERLKDPSLEGKSKGFVQFLDDNYDKIAGMAGTGSDKNPALSVTDVMTLASMNQVDPVRMQAGAQFLKDKFFQISGMDDKVNAQRVERLLFDHSFSLFPKETQERLNDIVSVVKSVDQSPSAFDQSGKRTRSGLTSDDAQKLNATELGDNLRIQSLQKGMFGGKTVKFDAKQISPDARTQYEAAQKRYHELQNKGLDQFLAGLEKQY